MLLCNICTFCSLYLTDRMHCAASKNTAAKRGTISSIPNLIVNVVFLKTAAKMLPTSAIINTETTDSESLQVNCILFFCASLYNLLD